VIDFRYHLVSLVSVFMALAIGVVLGAGPLQDSIGDQLSNQVEGLLQDKSDLQQAVQNREADVAARDSFIDAVAGGLTGSRLAGRDVVVVTLPGADSGTVDALTEGIASAGAEVTGSVAVNPRWTDPEQAAFRESLAAQLLPFLEEAPADTASVEEQLGALLAAAVLTPQAGAQGTPDAQTVLDGLSGGDLVSLDGEPQSRAALAVVVTGPVEESANPDDAEVAEASAAGHLALLAALDAGSSGVVLAGPVAATADAGLIGQLRADDELAGRVSSVDSADSPMGRVTTVLTLDEEAAGRAGQYGYGENASAPVPTQAVDPVPPQPTEPTTGTDG